MSSSQIKYTEINQTVLVHDIFSSTNSLYHAMSVGKGKPQFQEKLPDEIPNFYHSQTIEDVKRRTIVHIRKIPHGNGINSSIMSLYTSKHCYPLRAIF